jgi:ATP-dependent DNA helicase RecG
VDVQGKLYFTNAGALFFRQNDQDVLFRHAKVVCALYKGTGKAIILDVKELDGGLEENIEHAMLFLKQHLKLRYEIKTLRRENILELPESALREAIVNAVCHRDYFEKGARIMVEVFDDRVDITNPGGFCKGLSKENFGTVSVTRNSLLASLLHRIHFIEEMGTGIERMRIATQAAGVPDPEFRVETKFWTISFKRLDAASEGAASSDDFGTNFGINDLSTEKNEANFGITTHFDEKFGAIFGINFGANFGLTDTQKKILLLAQADSTINVQDIADQIGQTKRSIEYNIKKLKDKGLLQRVGANKNGTWIVNHGATP